MQFNTNRFSNNHNRTGKVPSIVNEAYFNKVRIERAHQAHMEAGKRVTTLRTQIFDVLVLRRGCPGDIIRQVPIQKEMYDECRDRIREVGGKGGEEYEKGIRLFKAAWLSSADYRAALVWLAGEEWFTSKYNELTRLAKTTVATPIEVPEPEPVVPVVEPVQELSTETKTAVDTFAGMTAREIATMVELKTGKTIQCSVKSKKTIIKKALAILTEGWTTVTA